MLPPWTSPSLPPTCSMSPRYEHAAATSARRSMLLRIRGRSCPAVNDTYGSVTASYPLQAGADSVAAEAWTAHPEPNISQVAMPAADATAHIATLQHAAEPAATDPASAAPRATGAAALAAGAHVPDAADASCVMCLDLPKDVILAPCGHQCLCRQGPVHRRG
jgi:Zinc finger, C3HC4 type (RING finger)